MKLIPLTQGKFAIVDDEDYERLSANKWRAHKEGRAFYAVRSERIKTGPRRERQVRMHAVIAATPPGMETDHVDGDGLNNRRSNLRVVTPQQNQRNQRNKRHGCSSRFRGVTLHKPTGKWQAAINTGARTVYLGLFVDEIDAARAFDIASQERDPDYYALNFPHGEVSP